MYSDINKVCCALTMHVYMVYTYVIYMTNIAIVATTTASTRDVDPFVTHEFSQLAYIYMIGVSCICIHHRLISCQRPRGTETQRPLAIFTILANGLCVEPYVELYAELDAAIFKIATTSTRDVGFYV